MTTQPITFLWGHPVPYSLTVQRNGRSIGARPHLEAVREQFAQNVPDRETIITKVEGAYVFYDYMPEGWRRPRVTFAAIDVGFDVREEDMLCEYPAWAGDGPVLLEYSTDARKTGVPSKKIARKCDSKGEALRILRRHGYRVRVVKAREEMPPPIEEHEKPPPIEEHEKPDEVPAYVRRLRKHPRVDGDWVRIHDDGILEMRNPNEGLSSDPKNKSRYQYRVTEDGDIEERRLPPESVGDAWRDIGIPEWEYSSTPPRDELLYAWWEEQVL